MRGKALTDRPAHPLCPMGNGSRCLPRPPVQRPHVLRSSLGTGKRSATSRPTSPPCPDSTRWNSGRREAFCRLQTRERPPRRYSARGHRPIPCPPSRGPVRARAAARKQVQIRSLTRKRRSVRWWWALFLACPARRPPWLLHHGRRQGKRGPPTLPRRPRANPRQTAPVRRQRYNLARLARPVSRVWV